MLLVMPVFQCPPWSNSCLTSCVCMMLHGDASSLCTHTFYRIEWQQTLSLYPFKCHLQCLLKKNRNYLLSWSLCECKVAASHSSSVFLSASLYVFIPPLHLHLLPFLFLSQCFWARRGERSGCGWTDWAENRPDAAGGLPQSRWQRLPEADLSHHPGQWGREALPLPSN